MTMFIFAARCPSNRQQFLNQSQSFALAASLTRQAEDAIASEMAQDYQTRQDHAISTPANPTSSNPRHPHRGQYYRTVQRNNNRATHAGISGRLSQKSVTRLLALYSHRCLKCGSQADLTLDHIVPICKGGRGDILNIQPLCSRCNNTKAEQVADYRPRLTMLAVYAIHSLYHLDRLTHTLRHHYRRALYRFDRAGSHRPRRYHAAIRPALVPVTRSGASSGYHFDTDHPTSQAI